MKNLNKEELLIGAIFGLTFWFVLGWWVIPVAICTSLLWAIGGTYGHSIRVFGVPSIVCTAAYLLSHKWLVLISYPFGALILSMGYGIPSTQPPDAGSTLGRFWWGICKQNPFWTDVCTRGTIYLLLGLVFLPVYLCR
jgi:ribose/xylose/arabinose/galactoside ABC-type transport system permease subunit